MSSIAWICTVQSPGLLGFKIVILRKAKMIQPQPIDFASLLQRAPFLTVQLKYKES